MLQHRHAVPGTHSPPGAEQPGGARAYDDNVRHGARPFPLSAEAARTHSYFVLYPIFLLPQGRT